MENATGIRKLYLQMGLLDSPEWSRELKDEQESERRDNQRLLLTTILLAGAPTLLTGALLIRQLWLN